jgi:hypothetical protein
VAWCGSEQQALHGDRPPTREDRPLARARPISLPGDPSFPGPAVNGVLWATSTQCPPACAAGWGVGAARATRGGRECGGRHGGGGPLLRDSCLTGLGSPRRRGTLRRRGGRPAPWSARRGGREGGGTGCGQMDANAWSCSSARDPMRWHRLDAPREARRRSGARKSGPRRREVRQDIRGQGDGGQLVDGEEVGRRWTGSAPTRSSSATI